MNFINYFAFQSYKNISQPAHQDIAPNSQVMVQALVLPNPIRSLDLYSPDTRHSPPHPPPATPHPDHQHRHTELQPAYFHTCFSTHTVHSTSWGVWCVLRHHEYHQTHLETHSVPRSQSPHTHISYWKVCGVVWCGGAHPY